MKKSIVLLLVMAIIGSCVTACDGSNKKTDKKSGETNDVNVEQTDKTEKTEKTEEESEQTENSGLLRDYSFRIAGTSDDGIWIGVPGWHEVELGYATLFSKSQEEMVVVACNKDAQDDSSVISSLSTAHESSFNEFVLAIQNYNYVTGLTVTSESTDTINGMEVYRFEGVLNIDETKIQELAAVGYSFVFDGMPITIIGYVRDEAQDQEMYDEVKAILDAMILTVKDKEE